MTKITRDQGDNFNLQDFFNMAKNSSLEQRTRFFGSMSFCVGNILKIS